MQQGVCDDFTDCNLREVRDFDLSAAGKIDGSRMAAGPDLFDSLLVNEDQGFLHSFY